MYGIKNNSIGREVRKPTGLQLVNMPHSISEDPLTSGDVDGDGEIGTDTSAISSDRRREIKSGAIENMTTVIHVILLQYVIYLLYISFKDERRADLFRWHPALLTVGWSLLMCEAILSISSENYLVKYFSHKTRVRIHWVLQVVGALFITAGFIVIVVNKNMNNKSHFKSWHAKVGLASFIAMTLTCLGGVAALYNLRLRTYVRPVVSKVIHGVCGILTYVLGSITCILGLYTNWFFFNSNQAGQIICTIIIVICTVWPLIRPFRTLYTRMKVIFR